MTHPARTDLAMLAGSIAHMARFLHTGCPRAEQLSGLLLERVGQSSELPSELVHACHELQDAIWEGREGRQRLRGT